MKSWIAVVLSCFMVLQVSSLCFAGDDERLVDLGNGIVQDSKTGLMWQLDKSRRSVKSVDAAESYAKESRLGGFADWRVPTLAERWDLLQVFVYKNNGVVEFTKATSRYWTRETDKGTQPIKLDISCLCLSNEDIDYSSRGYVRLVRN